MISEHLKKHKYLWIFIGCSVLFYISFAYDLERTDLTKLFGLYLGLFYFFHKIIQTGRNQFKLLFAFGLISRIVLLWSVPNLSQDFYRFIWDGELLLQGISPYLYTPDDIINNALFSLPNGPELYQEMGSLSASHYSNYPPLNQLFFAMAAFFGGSGITGKLIFLRLFIIGGDLMLFSAIRKIMGLLKIPDRKAFFYWLNPFIVIELTGNLHFEGIMMAFFIFGIWLLFEKKWFLSAIMVGAAVSVKLLPLMFLPIFIPYLLKTTDLFRGMNKWLGIVFYMTVVAGITLVGFLPVIDLENIHNFMASIALWFGKFEFNASIYYLIREIGYWVKGYNIIETYGKYVAIFMVVCVIGLTLLRKNKDKKVFLESLFFSFLLYLLTGTTVHPWYLTSLFVLGLFTRFKFPLLWTLLVFLSYSTYSNPDYEENYWLLLLEYGIVYWVLGKEILAEFTKRKKGLPD